MLVLSRKPNQSIVIGNSIVVKVIEVNGRIVRLGIDAPSHVIVHREEIYEKIKKQEAQKARASDETGETGTSGGTTSTNINIVVTSS